MSTEKTRLEGIRARLACCAEVFVMLRMERGANGGITYLHRGLIADICDLAEMAPVLLADAEERQKLYQRYFIESDYTLTDVVERMQHTLVTLREERDEARVQLDAVERTLGQLVDGLAYHGCVTGDCPDEHTTFDCAAALVDAINKFTDDARRLLVQAPTTPKEEPRG